jgi:hypothetical protein
MINVDKFTYNRNFPPLYFSPQSPRDRENWDISANKISREFYKILKLPSIDYTALLSNGMTLGEYSMYLIWSINRKRK